MVKSIGSEAEFDQIISSGKVVVVDFWAPWCEPCKTISPLFEKNAEALKDNPDIEFYKANIEEWQFDDEKPKIEAITAIPAFRVFKNGEQLGKLNGARPSELNKLIEAHIPN